LTGEMELGAAYKGWLAINSFSQKSARSKVRVRFLLEFSTIIFYGWQLNILIFVKILTGFIISWAFLK
jgi:hypothetical protein